MELRLSRRDLGSTVVVALDGLADLATVPALQSGLRRELAMAAGRTVVVDVDGLIGLDDAALGVFLGAAATARDQGGDLEILCTSERWQRRFEATGVDRALVVRTRLGDADG